MRGGGDTGTSTVLFTWKEAGAVLGAVPFLPEAGGLHDEKGFTSVSIDSRTVERGGLFAALSGERTDGHRFVKAAFNDGAAGALVRRDCVETYALKREAENAGAALLVAEDTRLALQELSRAYLDRFPRLLRIGITGSSGKTTTKEITAAIIGKEKRVVYNAGNLNSDIGLPLSVFKTRAEHEAGIFELGMNRRGEMAEIAGVLRPHIALITNAGTAHIGIIGSREGIAKEKAAIFSFFTGSETAFIPAESDFAGLLAKDIKGKTVFYSVESAGIKNVVDRGIYGWEFDIDSEQASFHLPGRHNLQNAAAAVMLGRCAGISAASIAAALSEFRTLSARSEIVEKEIGAGRGRITVINDSYNANPDSMEKTLLFFDELAWSGRKILVLGEMMELGAVREREHEKLFSRMREIKAEKKYFFQAATFNVPADDGVMVYDDIGKLKNKIERECIDGDLILLKGSRGCALERILGA
jgi:UDP-N-acetylmuramoyl-tripeptide--D-alanyl-D-alanine ligase